jgi:hypothetical protein
MTVFNSALPVRDQKNYIANDTKSAAVHGKSYSTKTFDQLAKEAGIKTFKDS